MTVINTAPSFMLQSTHTPNHITALVCAASLLQQLTPQKTTQQVADVVFTDTVCTCSLQNHTEHTTAYDDNFHYVICHAHTLQSHKYCASCMLKWMARLQYWWRKPHLFSWWHFSPGDFTPCHIFTFPSYKQYIMGCARNFVMWRQRGSRAKGIGGQNRAYVLGASSYMWTCGGE